MARILTVDDSRSVRMIVTKQLADLNLEIEEAEHGEEGLQKLEELEFDLVLLDVTMPVLDGPGMLERMRAAGNKTPVVMLTSESKRSIVASLVKMGIDDYILKPFRPEELRAKVLKCLKRDESAVVMSDGRASENAPAGAAISGAKSFVDVLVVDDMENVHKKLRSLLPERLTMNSSVSGQAALTQCRERVYRMILVDKELPDVAGTSLIKQLKTLQPNAAVLAMTLRTTNDIGAEIKALAFDGVLYKPFTQDVIEDLLIEYFDTQELTHRDDNIVRISEYKGKRERLDKYYKRLLAVLKEDLNYLAQACFEDVVVNALGLPNEVQKNPQLVRDVAAEAEKLGLQLRLVGNADLAQCLKGYTETAQVPIFSDVSVAKQAVA